MSFSSCKDVKVSNDVHNNIVSAIYIALMQSEGTRNIFDSIKEDDITNKKGGNIVTGLKVIRKTAQVIGKASKASKAMGKLKPHNLNKSVTAIGSKVFKKKSRLPDWLPPIIIDDGKRLGFNAIVPPLLNKAGNVLNEHVIPNTKKGIDTLKTDIIKKIHFNKPTEKNDVSNKNIIPAAAVGLFTLYYLNNALKKRRNIRKLLQEDPNFYKCRSGSTCPQLEYMIKPYIVEFILLRNFQKDVLFMYTNENNKGLFFDKMNFNINNAKNKKEPVALHSHIVERMEQLIQIQTQKNKWLKDYANFFKNQSISQQLLHLNVIPSHPKVIFVCYEYFPYNKQLQDDIKKQDKLLKYANGPLKDTLKYNNNEYVLDAMIMSNFNKELGDHLICGISCNDTKYVYIGTGVKDDKSGKTKNCNFIEYDWFNNKPFCLNDDSCKINNESFETQMKEHLCFNKTTGTRVYIYVLLE
jgi:hypothetical protein